jgi:hypothetical protein
MAHNPYDKAARYAARLDPPAFLSWVLNLPTGDFTFDGWLDTRSVALPQGVERIGDTVAALRDLKRHGIPWAIPIEFQIEPDPGQFGRLLMYSAAIWLQQRPSGERGDRYEIGCGVINLTGTGTTSRQSVWSEAGLETTLRVVERNLATESAAELLDQIERESVGRCVLPWIPLMQDGEESGILAQWKRVALAEPDGQNRSDYGALAIVFAEAACRDVAWKRALKGWNIMESKQVLEWQAEARKEGIVEGKAQGKCESIVDVLSTRFGTVPATLQRKLGAIQDLTLLSAHLALATKVASLKEFRRLAGL